MNIFRAVLWLFCSVLIGIIPNFAQEQKQPVEKKDSVCPQIVNIRTTPDCPGKGKKQTFTADFISPPGFKPEFKWSVYQGKIIDGQGTNSVVIAFDSECAETTATVEIVNALKECSPVVASASTLTDCCWSIPNLFDEYEKVSQKSEKSILDEFIKSLQKDSNFNIYIARHLKRDEKPTQAKLDLMRVAGYLTKVGKIDENRISVAIVDSWENQRIQLWVVPPWTEPPSFLNSTKPMSVSELKASILQNKPQPKKKRRAKRGK